MALVEDGIEPILFHSYPRDDRYLLELRLKVNTAIKAKGTLRN